MISQKFSNYWVKYNICEEQLHHGQEQKDC